MTDTVAERDGAMERVPTHIPGLDDALEGGLVRGGVYLVGGRPGTGKTTLGNQLAHAHARTGGAVLFATILSESHERMVAHLQSFAFFDRRQLARGIHYLSLYDALRDHGLAGVLTQLRDLVRAHGASLLVVDGAQQFERNASIELEYMRFTADLQMQLAFLGCTLVLLSDYDGQGTNHIATVVDGIIILRDESLGLRRLRLLEVVKLRGGEHLRGQHEFAITPAGLAVYPRLEALLTARPPVASASRERLRFGVPGLDAMLHGGLFAASTTLVLGSPGAGKTTSGLHFIVEGARRGEPGLIVSFHETPPRLVDKAEAAALELGRHVQEGRVRILWRPPLEVLLDAWGSELLAVAAEHRAQRLFVDAITDVERLTLFPPRLPLYLAAFTNELRARGMTTLLAAEANGVVGAGLEIPLPAVSATVENILVLRYVELRSQLHRLVSILKVRQSAYDTAIREFVITERGMEVAETFASAESVLTGIGPMVSAAQPAPSGDASSSTPQP